MLLLITADASLGVNIIASRAAISPHSKFTGFIIAPLILPYMMRRTPGIAERADYFRITRRRQRAGPPTHTRRRHLAPRRYK